MWTVIQAVGGWLSFCGLLIFFVYWVGKERTFFSGQDPEKWEPDAARDIPPAAEEHPHVAALLARFPSLGKPA